MSYRGSPWGASPFYTPPVPEQKPKNYSDTFVASDYECKTTIDLESYARNLRNTLMGLLSQTPFPGALFDKLEQRLDGITCILQKRYAVSNVSNAEQAKVKMEAISKRLDALVTVPNGMDTMPGPPLKKRKYEPCVSDVRKALEQERERPKFIINVPELEEEEHEQ